MVNDFLGDMFDKVTNTADLMRKVGCKTLLAHDIAAGVHLEMHGELQMFSMWQGMQALTLVVDSYGLDTHEHLKDQYLHTAKKAKL